MARPRSIAASAALPQNRTQPAAAPLRNLITTIVTKHHEYLKRELPAIEAAVAEAARAEGGSFHETASAMFPLFQHFRRELEAHMKREESTLFPLIERLECALVAGQPAPRNSFGPLSNAIQFMNEDHDFENKLLGMMAEASDGFSSPPEAPSNYATLMHRLRLLKRDLDEHVRKEDEVLFPEVIRLEKSAG